MGGIIPGVSRAGAGPGDRFNISNVGEIQMSGFRPGRDML